mgnify:FL=1|jgi:hypothetical protein
MTALYELAAEYRADAEKLADMDLDEQTLADTLEGLGGELEVKAQNVIMFTRNLEATAAAIKEAEAQMAARRKALENRAAGLRRYVLENMQFAGIQKIECPFFKLSIRDNPAAVEIYEPGLIPAQFMKQPEPPPPSPDKTAIKAAITAGTEVPGAKLTKGTRLDIK